MKILKGVLFALLGLIVLFLLVAALLKKSYSVEEEVTIAKPSTEVYNYLKYLKNHNAFSTWSKKDPNVINTYKGTDGTVGFIGRWESESDEVGVGEQEIVKMTEGERLDYELRFYSPQEGTAPCYMITESTGANQTKVKWGFSSTMPYPSNVLIYLMDFENMIGTEFKQGLTNLKGILEK